MKNVFHVKTINLFPLAAQVKENSRIFNLISFSHVYRELNTIVDSLSKVGLNLLGGMLYLEDFVEDDVT
jgi:hypothetical protein